MTDRQKLVEAIDRLEDALAAYFADRDIPLEISAAVYHLEAAMIDVGLSPLELSGIAQRTPDPEKPIRQGPPSGEADND